MKNYKVDSLLICDDVRLEVEHKEILIGVYNNFIFVNGFPQLLPTFCIRVTVSLKDDKFPSESTLAVISPDGQQIARATFPVRRPLRFIGGFPIHFRFSPFVFSGEGAYVVQFGFDERLDRVGKFFVEIRPPNDRAPHDVSAATPDR